MTDLTEYTERVAEAVGQHGYDGGFRCDCGWIGGWEEHNTHLAAALLAPGGVVAEIVAEGIDRATEAMLTSDRWAAFVKREQEYGATRALLAAAKEAEERGDIGKPNGGIEAWDWLRGIVRRDTLADEEQS